MAVAIQVVCIDVVLIGWVAGQNHARVIIAKDIVITVLFTVLWVLVVCGRKRGDPARYSALLPREQIGQVSGLLTTVFGEACYSNNLIVKTTKIIITIVI